MRMRNLMFCLKHQVVGFIHNRFIYKLIRMVVYIVQTKAELLVYNCVKRFLYFIVTLQSCGLPNLIGLHYFLAY